jgi:hypothetical protein
VVANHPSGFFDLAAAPRQPLATTTWPTSPRKTRVGVFPQCPSGQTSSRRRCRSMFTPGSRACGYKTVSGRHEWPNRDPIGEPGFEVLRNGKANVAIGGVNLYLFVKNNAENYFDPLGLDIWVVRDKSGLIRHREAVGNNADGTYWSSDFGPTSHNLIHQCNCQGRINFNPNQLVLVPTNLPSDYVIESHTVVDQGATDAARDYAKQRADSSDQPRYDCCGNNCIDWANGLANYAMGRQLREDLDKIKNVK